MLHNMNDLDGCVVETADEVVGRICDAYFDNLHWAIRYLVVRSGGWLNHRKVMLSPVSIQRSASSDKRIEVTLTTQQFNLCPEVNGAKSMSRAEEVEFANDHGYPTYWNGPGLWGDGPLPYAMVPSFLIPDAVIDAERERSEHDIVSTLPSHLNDVPHLHSVGEIKGYGVQMVDGELGKVTGFVFDQSSWEIRYLVIDAGSWWSGNQVLMPTAWIKEVSCANRMLEVAVVRQRFKEAPPYDPSRSWTFDQERELFAAYARIGRRGALERDAIISIATDSEVLP